MKRWQTYRLIKKWLLWVLKFNAQNVGLKIFWLPIGGSRISGGTGGGAITKVKPSTYYCGQYYHLRKSKSLRLHPEENSGPHSGVADRWCQGEELREEILRVHRVGLFITNFVYAHQLIFSPFKSPEWQYLMSVASLVWPMLCFNSWDSFYFASLSSFL